MIIINYIELCKATQWILHLRPQILIHINHIILQ